MAQQAPSWSMCTIGRLVRDMAPFLLSPDYNVLTTEKKMKKKIIINWHK